MSTFIRMGSVSDEEQNKKQRIVKEQQKTEQTGKITKYKLYLKKFTLFLLAFYQKLIIQAFCILFSLSLSHNSTKMEKYIMANANLKYSSSITFQTVNSYFDQHQTNKRTKEASLFDQLQELPKKIGKNMILVNISYKAQAYFETQYECSKQCCSSVISFKLNDSLQNCTLIINLDVLKAQINIAKHQTTKPSKCSFIEGILKGNNQPQSSLNMSYINFYDITSQELRLMKQNGILDDQITNLESHVQQSKLLLKKCYEECKVYLPTEEQILILDGKANYHIKCCSNLIKQFKKVYELFEKNKANTVIAKRCVYLIEIYCSLKLLNGQFIKEFEEFEEIQNPNEHIQRYKALLAS